MESYEPCKVKTETAIWALAHKPLFLFLTLYCASNGHTRQPSIHKCGAPFATHLWIECMARNVGGRRLTNTNRRHLGIQSSLVIPYGFHDLGISSKTSFSYHQTFHSVGISNKISFSYPQFFHGMGISSKTSFLYPQFFHGVGISSKTSFSYPQFFHSVGISSKTSFSYPQFFHSVGISNKISNSYP